jgi:hypothetical protein
MISSEALDTMVAPAPALSAPSQLDIDMFVDQVAWLGRHLRDPSRLGVVSWLGRALRPEVRTQLYGLFRADHPLVQRAEAELLRLLRRPWQKHAPRYARLDVPERNVDWTRTYVEELTSPPSSFWSREVVQMLDAGLLGALCSLGQTLLDLGAMGEISPDRRTLRSALAHAIEMISRSVGRHRIPYTTLHEQRLLRMDPEAHAAARSISACLDFFRSKFGSDEDLDGLRALASQISEADLRCSNRTLDSLLELSASIAIARAATSTTSARGVADSLSWQLLDVDERDDKNVPQIRMVAGPFTCVISKTAPPEDALVPLLHQMGLTTRGHQPDIVMTFTLQSEDGHQASIVALADAKRNADKDGRRYLADSVEAAIVYAMAYGHLMGLRAHPGGRAHIDGDILPAVTLFCRQGVQLVAGSGPGAEEIVARLQHPAPLPAVVALDVRHFQGGGESRRSGSPILSAWFARVARQAQHALRHRLADTRPSQVERDPSAPRGMRVARRERTRREEGGDPS